MSLRLSRYKWKKRVEQVMERDGHKCRMCGRSEGLADVHHIIKRSQGGGDDMDNLILLCRDCHNRQHPEKQVQWTKKTQAAEEFEKLYGKEEKR